MVSRPLAWSPSRLPLQVLNRCLYRLYDAAQPPLSFDTLPPSSSTFGAFLDASAVRLGAIGTIVQTTHSRTMAGLGSYGPAPRLFLHWVPSTTRLPFNIAADRSQELLLIALCIFTLVLGILGLSSSPPPPPPLPPPDDSFTILEIIRPLLGHVLRHTASHTP
ncbi:hypothetical protein R3P38DRAFT_3183406 [Favolaschia claudopus]|uniref:Uncharacterized protein n=1 Tax=Favolaschia claudopus TaxID=2862362 RepID=A0AAW0C878_9AGAR